jgi:hypothetical protein
MFAPLFQNLHFYSRALLGFDGVFIKVTFAPKV